MRCCVPFCQSTSDKPASNGTGVTFHDVPNDIHLRAAWLRALGTQDHQLPDPAMVCSQHFLHDELYEINSNVRQIHSNAIPSTVQVCLICLDTDSKQVLMSKHKLEEAYEQLTGLALQQRGNLKQTICVLCAQRLTNFSRFRYLCLSAHLLMTDLLEQHQFITIQHREWMKYTTKHLQCNLTLTTLGADHCDLYINHTEEEEQTAAEESAVGDVASVVKNEDSCNFMSNADDMDLAQEDNDIERFKNDCVSGDEFSKMSIKLEPRLVGEGISESIQGKAAVSDAADHVAATKIYVKCESVTFECTLCFEEFMQENTYKKHMSMHFQRAASEASQVCELRTEESCSWDSLVLENKTGSQSLKDDSPPVAGCAWTINSPPSSTLVAINKLQSTEESKHIFEANTFGEHLNLKNLKSSKRSKLDNTHADERPYSCDLCHFTTAHKSHLSLHIKSHTGVKPYSCEICDYKCVRKYDLIKHIRTHTGEKPYSCETCNCKFAQKTDLTIHNRIHTGEKPFSCEVCNKTFAQRSHILNHMRIHTGEKPFSCELCDYKSAQRSSLFLHRRTHTGEKPYSCELCDYKSSVKYALLRHHRIHTGEKPFSCKICDFRSAQKSSLMTHMRIHTGEKPYSCDTCNYKCAQKNVLIVHKRTHTGEKPYSCDVCNFKGRQKSDLTKHKKTHW